MKHFLLFFQSTTKMTMLAISKRGHNNIDVVSGVTRSHMVEIFDTIGTAKQYEYYSCMEIQCPDENIQPAIIIQPELPSGISCYFE